MNYELNSYQRTVSFIIDTLLFIDLFQSREFIVLTIVWRKCDFSLRRPCKRPPSNPDREDILALLRTTVYNANDSRWVAHFMRCSISDGCSAHAPATNYTTNYYWRYLSQYASRWHFYYTQHLL